jgi:adenylosuccinate synthase
MTHKVYIVTDLGSGDGGKGGIVHKLTTMMPVHTVIKRGGAQGSHGVRTSQGQEFDFSQWGCGTFGGIPTHLSNQMIISPEGLLNEATHLRYEHGIYDTFSLLTVDERALCATPFHGIASRLHELVRGTSPRGTVGSGVGQAYRYHQSMPELSVLAGDLRSTAFHDRLVAIRSRIQADLRPVLDSQFLAQDEDVRRQEVDLLFDDSFLSFVIKRFDEAAAQLQIVDRTYLEEAILPKRGAAVVESSHGVLTDRLVGFKPHTSAIRTLPHYSEALLRDAGYDQAVVHLGVTRAYAVRHGAGPLPTQDDALADRLLPNRARGDNRYQGAVRAGALDITQLRYAIDACGGPTAFHGMAVTCFDQVQSTGTWDVCFTRDPEPTVTRVPLAADASTDDLFDLCARTLQPALDIPVRMVSFGPNELDKLAR